MRNLQQAHQLGLGQRSTLVTAIDVRVGPRKVEVRVDVKPTGSTAPGPEADHRLAVDVPRNGAHSFFRLVVQPMLDPRLCEQVESGYATLSSDPFQSATQHRDAPWIAAFGVEMAFVCVQMAHQGDLGVLGRAILFGCQRANPDKVSTALSIA